MKYKVTMNKKIFCTTCFCLAMVLLFVVSAKSQVNEEVISVKPYSPTLGDVYKIHILPDLADTTTEFQNFKYKVFPNQLPSTFNIVPINPAKMSGEALPKLYSTYIKLGYGNKNTLLGEAGINLQRSKKYAGGVFYRHLSSNSDMKLGNGTTSPASYSDNKISVFGKKINTSSAMYGDCSFERNNFHFYGLNTDLMPETEIEKKTYLQKFNKAEFNTGVNSIYPDSQRINYNIGLKYQYFEDDYFAYQNLLALNASLDHYYSSELIGVDAGFTWANRNSQIDTNNNALIVLSPWMRFSGDQWRIQCGLKLNADAYTDSLFYHFYPVALLQYNVIENFLIPFISFDGGIIQNHFSHSALQNQFIWPGLHLRNTNNRLNVAAGLRGNFSSKISFLLKGTYGLYENMHFFVNDTLGTGNYFNVVYDDETQVLNFHGEVSYKDAGKLNIFLRGDYYKYTLKNLIKPWHKPLWELNLSARYNLRNKIVTRLDLFAISEKYAPDFNKFDEAVKLDKIIDLNIGIEYRFTKLLSAFITINNITAKRNYYWNYYPTYRLHVLAGVTYSF